MATREKAPARATASAGSVIVQARVDPIFARELEVDVTLLGLRNTSDLVREGLRLIHQHARELAMATSYDEFHGGEQAPVSEVAGALWTD